MTSTPFNVGLRDNARLSSRVLRPPGGGHTDIFGGEPEPVPRRHRGPISELSEVMALANGVAQPEQNGQQNGEQNGQESSETPQSEQQIPEPAQKTESTVSEPEVTEPPIKAEAPKPEPPKRVRVPPGGFSSGLW